MRSGWSPTWWSSGCGPGASHGSSATPATASTRLMGALRRAGGDPTFVQARHEENAAFMAVGHAKYTGGVGVVREHAGSGRGAPAQRPVRRQARPPAGRRDRRTAADHRARRGVPAGDRPHRRSSRTSPRSTSQTVLRARAGARWSSTARSARRWPPARPCVVVLPHDVQAAPAPEAPPHEHGVVPTAPAWRPPRVVPADDDLAERRGGARTPASGSRCSSGQGAARRRRPGRARWPSGSAPGSPPACSASRTSTSRCRSAAA